MVDQERSRSGLDRAANRLDALKNFGPGVVGKRRWRAAVADFRSQGRQGLIVVPRSIMLCVVTARACFAASAGLAY